ncbi:MAG: hypothetical protein ACMZ7B_01755 [Balneola sp.]
MRITFYIKKIIHQEQGSALATVLIISVIISLFIGAIFSGIILQSRFIQRDINYTKALYAAEEGGFRFLNSFSVNEFSETPGSVITKEEGGTITKSVPFGGFLDVQSTAEVSGQKRTVRMLAGTKSGSVFGKAVALGDSTSALTVTGNTIIRGDVVTYNTAVKAENFKGVPFQGSFDGEQVSFSDSFRFPRVETAMFELQENHFNSLFENQGISRFSSGYRGAPTTDFQQGDTLLFSENTEWTSNQRVGFPMDMTIIVDGNFILNGDYQFRPFTKIIVKDTLLVGGTVSGKNILLFAGKSLQIGGGASISAQVMSEGSIVIRDDAYLQYPSMVYSSKESYQGGEREVINITGRSIIDGLVLYSSKTNLFTQDLLRVKIDTDATVRGGVFNAGQTELLGTVLGSVVTHQFYFYESPTSYINWLKDITIDVSQRPPSFVIPLGFADSTKYELVDWYEIKE